MGFIHRTHNRIYRTGFTGFFGIFHNRNTEKGIDRTGKIEEWHLIAGKIGD